MQLLCSFYRKLSRGSVSCKNLCLVELICDLLVSNPICRIHDKLHDAALFSSDVIKAVKTAGLLVSAWKA